MSDDTAEPKTASEIQALLNALPAYQPSPAYQQLVGLILWGLRHLLPTMYPSLTSVRHSLFATKTFRGLAR